MREVKHDLACSISQDHIEAPVFFLRSATILYEGPSTPSSATLQINHLLRSSFHSPDINCEPRCTMYLARNRRNGTEPIT